jgi:hypothetical protein
MSIEVVLWELNTNSETLDGHDDSSDFLEDLIIDAPFSGSEYIEGNWAKNDSKDDGQRRFRQM